MYSHLHARRWFRLGLALAAILVTAGALPTSASALYVELLSGTDVRFINDNFYPNDLNPSSGVIRFDQTYVFVNVDSFGIHETDVELSGTARRISGVLGPWGRDGFGVLLTDFSATTTYNLNGGSSVGPAGSSAWQVIVADAFTPGLGFKIPGVVVDDLDGSLTFTNLAGYGNTDRVFFDDLASWNGVSAGHVVFVLDPLTGPGLATELFDWGRVVSPPSLGTGGTETVMYQLILPPCIANTACTFTLQNSGTAEVVPEPPTGWTLAAGMIALAAVHRRGSRADAVPTSKVRRGIGRLI